MGSKEFRLCLVAFQQAGNCLGCSVASLADRNNEPDQRRETRRRSMLLALQQLHASMLGGSIEEKSFCFSLGPVASDTLCQDSCQRRGGLEGWLFEEPISAV